MKPKQAQMTYQFASPCERPPNTRNPDRIAIQLLQVCRKIHSEALPLFYKKNIFSFTGEFPVSTALTFLRDRPAYSLSLITSLELVLAENNNMRGTAEAHFPLTRRSSDCLVLQYAFHYFTDLCTLLSSSVVGLRQLYLTIESLSSYGDLQPTTLSECLAWEIEKNTIERPWIASWVEPLLHIQSLESIKIYWVADRPRVRRISDTLAAMQRSMLGHTSIEGDNHELNFEGHEIEFGMLKGLEDSATLTVVSDPRVEHLKWGDCSCDSRSNGLEHISEGSSGKTKAFYRCGVATWKEHRNSFHGFRSAYTSYCELGSTRTARSARQTSSSCAVHLGQ
jgi:hypothetical protein